MKLSGKLLLLFKKQAALYVNKKYKLSNLNILEQLLCIFIAEFKKF